MVLGRAGPWESRGMGTCLPPSMRLNQARGSMEPMASPGPQSSLEGFRLCSPALGPHPEALHAPQQQCSVPSPPWTGLQAAWPSMDTP